MGYFDSLRQVSIDLAQDHHDKTAVALFVNDKIGSYILDIRELHKLGVVFRAVCYALMALRRRLIICSELAIVACFRDSIILPSASCSNAP